MIPDPTVFVVDDDAAMRKSLRFLVESVGLKVETYETAERFLESYTPERPGCLVLDLRMPGMGGLRLQEELAARKVSLPVIIITGHAEVSTAVIAMKKGAVDFIQKPVGDEMLLDAVRQAIEHDREVRDAAARRADFAARLAQLTPRERAVMGGVVAGKANKVIAAELDIGEKTVESHRSRVMKKLGVESVAELVHLALASRQDTGKP
jgi:two-component system response regulator FixJ